MEEQPIQEVSLREILGALQRRWWIMTAMVAAGLLVAALVTVRMPRIYEAKSQIEIKTPNTTPTSALLSFQGINADTFKQTQLALLTNPAVYDQIQAELNQQGIHVDVKRIPKMLETEDRHNTDLIDLKVRDRDPALAQSMANAAATGFRDYKDKVADESAQRDLKTMQSRVQQAQEAMDRTGRDLADFEKMYGIINLPDETKEKITSISAMQQQAGLVKQNLDATRARIDSIQEQLARANAAIQSSGPRSDALIEQLQEHLSQQQQRLDQIRQTTVNQTWLTAPLEADIADTRQRLDLELSKATSGPAGLQMQAELQDELQKAQRDIVSYQAQYDTVVRQILAATNSMKDLPGKERTFAQLSQNADVARELYQKTLESFQQVEMDRLAHPSVIDITQPAVLPDKPVSPRPWLNLALGLLMGLALGLVAVLALEHLDEAVHSENDLQKLEPELPVLGTLPSLSAAEIADPGSLSPVSRAPYRLLWANIGFSALDDGLHNMVVTSAVQGEGKSLTCAHLARAAAEEGRRIILVDCDLRRPSQHRNFGASGALGLCEVLAGKISLEEALLPTDQPNLLLLPAGKTLPLNPAVLFKSDRFGLLMEELARRADFVLYDAPPSLVMPDAMLLGARCQGVMQVVEANRTSREHISKVAEGIARARARHIGLVLNKMRKAAMGHYGHYYNNDGNGLNGNGRARRKMSSPSTNGNHSKNGS